MAKLGTAYVKVKPEIDLSELDDDFLEALASRVAEKLRAQILPPSPKRPEVTGGSCPSAR